MCVIVCSANGRDRLRARLEFAEGEIGNFVVLSRYKLDDSALRSLANNILAFTFRMNALGVAHCNIVGHNILYRPHDLRYPFVIINFSAAEPLTKIQFGNDQENAIHLLSEMNFPLTVKRKWIEDLRSNPSSEQERLFVDSVNEQSEEREADVWEDLTPTMHSETGYIHGAMDLLSRQYQPSSIVHRPRQSE